MVLPFVSVVVLNYNGERFIKDCLESLKNIDYDNDRFEVIVVDNASTDKSVEVIKKYTPWAKFIETGKNLGYAGGNNVGVENAKGEYLVILNPDTEVDKNWLKELVKHIISDSGIGACSSKVLYYADKSKINTIGGFWSVLGVSGSIGEMDSQDKYDDTVYTFYPTGCSMIMKKELYLSLGKFDDDYFLYCEDPDIGWRIWDNGYKVCLAPKSIVYHLGSAALKGLGKKSYSNLFYFYNTRNGLLTIIKNATTMDLLWMVPLYFVSWSTLAFLFLIRGKFIAAKSTIKGLIWPVSNLPWVIKKRYTANYKRTGKSKYMMTGFIDTLKIFFKSKFGKHFL
ncbi:MAG: glycosyltransferase family 2 protein [Candidatus Aenigmarchaeota archaeon]|nr:glycosyltransferase family 2 protein [Candidatus Aenigmarchaeota archaeon]